ncbi:MAG TPA: SWIM zinc finger family protein [Xenococcaceae cyanobacterium]
MNNFEVQKQEWWVERWLDLLNTYHFKKRLERGRSYAREGNVLSMDFVNSKVKAMVQGSDDEPYRVSISLDSFSKEDWNYALAQMSEQAIFTAQLLAGEMPESIEAVFTKSGLSLFPFSLNEVRSSCTCPDKANPCKHIAAVYYQLAERFSEDPFIIFQLRGRTRNQIIEPLRQIRNQSAVVRPVSQATIDVINAAINSEDDTTESVKGFWQYDEPLESSLVAIVPPSEQKNVLDILGKMPLPPTDAETVQQYLQETYKTTGQKALMSALNRAADNN